VAPSPRRLVESMPKLTRPNSISLPTDTGVRPNRFRGNDGPSKRSGFFADRTHQSSTASRPPSRRLPTCRRSPAGTYSAQFPQDCLGRARPSAWLRRTPPAVRRPGGSPDRLGDPPGNGYSNPSECSFGRSPTFPEHPRRFTPPTLPAVTRTTEASLRLRPITASLSGTVPPVGGRSEAKNCGRERCRVDGYSLWIRGASMNVTLPSPSANS